MGNNANPLLAGLPWANGTNYPSGAYGWSGQPIKVTPAYSYFTPSVNFAPTAEELNAIFNQRDLIDLDLYARVGQLDGVNWPSANVAISSILSASAMQYQPPVYNAAIGLWMCGFAVSGETVLVSTNGTSWGYQTSTHPSLSSLVDEIAVNPATGVAVACEAGASYTALYAPSTGAWTETSGPGAASVGTSRATYFVGGAVFVVANNYGYGDTGDANFWWSASGSGWTASAGVLGAGSSTDSDAWFAQSSSLLLFVLGSNTTNFLASADGKTWTSYALPTALANEAPGGCCYDAVTGLFFLAMTKGDSSQTRIFTSTNGTAFGTLVATLPYAVRWLCAENGVVMGIAESSSGKTHMGVCSVDGGVTWRFTQLRSPSFGNHLTAGGSQFLYQNINNSNLQLNASLAVGLPPAVVTLT